MCDVCAVSPCAGICPNNDPYFGDHGYEHEKFERGAENLELYAMRREAEEEARRETEMYDGLIEQEGYEEAIRNGFSGTFDEYMEDQKVYLDRLAKEATEAWEEDQKRWDAEEKERQKDPDYIPF